MENLPKSCGCCWQHPAPCCVFGLGEPSWEQGRSVHKHLMGAGAGLRGNTGSTIRNSISSAPTCLPSRNRSQELSGSGWDPLVWFLGWNKQTKLAFLGQVGLYPNLRKTAPNWAFASALQGRSSWICRGRRFASPGVSSLLYLPSNHSGDGLFADKFR